MMCHLGGGDNDMKTRMLFTGQTILTLNICFALLWFYPYIIYYFGKFLTWFVSAIIVLMSLIQGYLFIKKIYANNP